MYFWCSTLAYWTKILEKHILKFMWLLSTGKTQSSVLTQWYYLRIRFPRIWALSRLFCIICTYLQHICCVDISEVAGCHLLRQMTYHWGWSKLLVKDWFLMNSQPTFLFWTNFKLDKLWPIKQLSKM